MVQNSPFLLKNLGLDKNQACISRLHHNSLSIFQNNIFKNELKNRFSVLACRDWLRVKLRMFFKLVLKAEFLIG